MNVDADDGGEKATKKCDYTPPMSCVKTFVLSSEIHSQNVLLPNLKMHYDVTFQPAVPET